MLRSASLGLLFFLSSGCSLFNRVRVDPVATSFQKPSNVAVYVAVSDGDLAVTDLQPESFKVYENEQLLDADDTHQLLLPKELAAYHHTLLLVDVSGEGSADDRLARAVASFVETVRATQAVSVYAFDGGPNLHAVAEFQKSADTGPVDVRALSKWGSADTSRNLNGALLSGLKELDARLAAQAKRVRVGTLVLFTRGSDLAGRVSQADAERAVSNTTDDVIALSIAEQTGRTLSDIGKSGVVRAQNEDALGTAFEEAALKARDLYDKHYLIAYCSPARGGSRRLKVEVRFRNREGEDKQGAFFQDFDATGFGPGCRSESMPRFVPPPVHKPDGHAAAKGTTTNESKPVEAPVPSGVAEPAPAADDDGVAPPPNKPGYSH